jgi:hypothetical protein
VICSPFDTLSTFIFLAEAGKIEEGSSNISIKIETALAKRSGRPTINLNPQAACIENIFTKK